MRRVAVAAAACLAVGTASACAHKRVARPTDPATARRFEIVAVSDTAFQFVMTGARWVRAGSQGLVVDPRRHDVLVARYTVQGTVADTASAIITGQTAKVAIEHVALLAFPRSSMWRQRAFWLGLLGGGAVGAATAVAAR